MTHAVTPQHKVVSLKYILVKGLVSLDLNYIVPHQQMAATKVTVVLNELEALSLKIFSSVTYYATLSAA